MKTIGKIVLFVFFILCMFLLKPRQDVVFEAIDTSQYIRLFENHRDFILCLDKNYTFTGTYAIKADTVFLSYREQVESSMAPQRFSPAAGIRNRPAKLYIDQNASKIASGDGQLFSAEISLDLREKPYDVTAYLPSELQQQRAKILAFGGLK